jgi:hypothetical protein
MTNVNDIAPLQALRDNTAGCPHGGASTDGAVSLGYSFPESTKTLVAP